MSFFPARILAEPPLVLTREQSMAKIRRLFEISARNVDRLVAAGVPISIAEQVRDWNAIGRAAQANDLTLAGHVPHEAAEELLIDDEEADRIMRGYKKPAQKPMHVGKETHSVPVESRIWRDKVYLPFYENLVPLASISQQVQQLHDSSLVQLERLRQARVPVDFAPIFRAWDTILLYANANQSLPDGRSPLAAAEEMHLDEARTSAILAQQQRQQHE